ncbi:MAG TPA: hypothetical protein VFA68_06650 [Terriglobales bacterium]|nr:hypothetical protein [Terriglobales bacterium]
MGRWFCVWSGTVVAVFLLAALVGCGSSRSTTNFPKPASLTLSPTPTASMDIGTTQSFTATAHNFSGRIITEPISFLSSNTAVLTIANNGMACAGTWDSLSAPTVCTPGPAGVAQVTATALGVNSPPTTVYVHQHVQSIQVTPAPVPPPPTTSCISKDTTENFQATAYTLGAGGQLVDITSTVGPFTWTQTNGLVVGLNSTLTTLPQGQVQATAKTPGVAQIYASAANVNGIPINFTTCPVESISLTVAGSNTTSFSTTAGTSKSITATVTDTLGNTITGVPLTWSSSNFAIGNVSSSGSVTMSSTQVGGVSVTASCTPPTCNIGILPSLPIYPTQAISGVSTRTSTTTPSQTVLVTTTGCSMPNAGNCATVLQQLTIPGSTSTAIVLPATPNSLVFNKFGTLAFLGTDSNQFGTKGLMILNVSGTTPTVFQNTSVVGKVLAVSGDGTSSSTTTKVVVADNLSTPNQVYIYDSMSNTRVALSITGAVAAAFSPDGLKAFIVAHDPAAGTDTLYIYSTLDALKAVPLGSPATDVTFHPTGAFGYLAGGAAASVTAYRTCDDALADTIGTPATPFAIRPVIDGSAMLALDPPNIDVIPVSLSGSGCQPTAAHSAARSINLGQGAITPSQFILSSDASKAYVVSQNLGSILIFDVGSETTGGISLVGNATPLRADLSSDGATLFVTASDDALHVIDTITNSDLQQIPFLPPNANLCANNVSFTCAPDLMAVKP